MKTQLVDKLTVKIYESRMEMGQKAALEIESCISSLLLQKESINMIFAAAPSQNEVLAGLVSSKTIDWSRINAFHMDEYVGLPSSAPQAFGSFLDRHIFGLLPFKSINYIDPSAKDPESECLRYSTLLADNPPDLVVMGIGENGHIAFNDPPVANFKDDKMVKIVELDPVCRQQQVNDGCFEKLSDVPTHALTLTVPALVSAPYLFCIVPAPTKAMAVRNTLYSDISEKCPASILRTHSNAILYLDPQSASLI